MVRMSKREARLLATKLASDRGKFLIVTEPTESRPLFLGSISRPMTAPMIFRARAQFTIDYHGIEPDSLTLSTTAYASLCADLKAIAVPKLYGLTVHVDPHLAAGYWELRSTKGTSDATDD